jgi:transposase
LEATHRIRIATLVTVASLVTPDTARALLYRGFVEICVRRRPGVGPVSAAQAIVSWSHRGRCRNDAAFAALAGSSPIPASSGRTVRHRLNCGGDRQLNRALHDITLTRWRVDPRTHTYIADGAPPARATPRSAAP